MRRATSVFPTPDGPRTRNTPRGRLRSPSPARARSRPPPPRGAGRLVGDRDAEMGLAVGTEPREDIPRFVPARLDDLDGLEAALERRGLLHPGAGFRDRRGPRATR